MYRLPFRYLYASSLTAVKLDGVLFSREEAVLSVLSPRSSFYRIVSLALIASPGALQAARCFLGSAAGQFEPSWLWPRTCPEAESRRRSLFLPGVWGRSPPRQARSSSDEPQGGGGRSLGQLSFCISTDQEGSKEKYQVLNLKPPSLLSDPFLPPKAPHLNKKDQQYHPPAVDRAFKQWGCRACCAFQLQHPELPQILLRNWKDLQFSPC